MKDYYTVLDLEENATDDEIRSQYRQLVRIYHPDRFSNPVDRVYAERKLQEINEAYRGLLAPERSGKTLGRRLTQKDGSHSLFRITPGSIFLLLFVLFAGVVLGSVGLGTQNEPNGQPDTRSFAQRFLESISPNFEVEAASAPLHDWMSFSVFEDYQKKIYVVGDDGELQIDVPISGHSPVWAPNRSHLAFLGTDGDGTQIYTIATELSGSERQRSRSGGGKNELARITQDADDKSHLVWSPDSSQLAYVATNASAPTPVLKLVNMETNQVLALTSERIGAVQRVAWLNADTILAEIVQDEESQILQLSTDGQAAQPFVNFAGGQPSVAPSGQRVVLTTADGIFTVASDGTDALQLTTTSAMQPVWSPGGTRIAYLGPLSPADDGRGDDRYAVWMIDSDGENLAQITEPGVLAFSWSVDGRSVAYVTGNLQAQPQSLYLWTIEIGGSPKLIAEISEPHISWGRGM